MSKSTEGLGNDQPLSNDMTVPSLSPAPDFYDESNEDRCRCDRCGGDGMIEYNDGDGSDWGEDCPSEINHLIICRQCRGTGEQP